jgi:hypothetical protein
VADVREECGLDPIELTQCLGTLLLDLVAAGAAHARGDVARDELDEAAVVVVEWAVPVQCGHQQSEWLTTLQRERHHEGLSGRVVPGTRRQTQCGTVKLDQFGFTTGNFLDGPHRTAVAGEHLWGRRMTGRDSAGAGKVRVTLVVEQVGQSEG